MLRDVLRSVREFVDGLSSKQRIWTLITTVGVIMFLGGLINLAPIAFWPKFGVFVIALIISAIFVYAFLTLRHTDDDDEQDQDETNPHIPPKPKRPPATSSQNQQSARLSAADDFEVDDGEMPFEHAEDNPSLYRYRFSIKPVIFKIFLVALGLVLLFFVAITNSSQELWLLWWVSIPVSLVYSYYIALRWNGEEFVVNDEWYERPLTMPFPFPSRTPAIRRSEIGKYEFKQTLIDKMLGTCRLYSDTPSAGDKQFHNVKWLTHPAELRRATGISAPRKNSYLFMLRKRKQ